MKMLHELTTADLDAHAIWRYHGKDDMQASVEPDTAFLIDGSGGAWIVKTQFTLADGTELSGYCSPIDDGIDYVQPVMIIGGVHHLPLFTEAAHDGMDTMRICERIDKAHQEIFPITFLCLVPLPDGSTLCGVIRKASDAGAIFPCGDDL